MKTKKSFIFFFLFSIAQLGVAQQLSFVNGGGMTVARVQSLGAEIVAFRSSGNITQPIQFKVNILKGSQAVSLTDTLFTISPNNSNTIFYDLTINVIDVSSQTTDSVLLELADIRGATAGSGIQYSFILLPATSTSLLENTFNIHDLITGPNPVTSSFIINSMAEMNGVQVIDAFGKSIFISNEMSTKYEIDMQALPAGIYFVLVSMNNTVSKQKVIKF